MPGPSFHQPKAYIDVALAGTKSVLKKAHLGAFNFGDNFARLIVEERPGAAPVTATLKAPDGATQKSAEAEQQDD